MRVLVLAAAMVFVLASRAVAATVGVTSSCDRDRSCVDTIHYRAMAGERTDLQLVDQTGGVLITGLMAPIAPGKDCHASGPQAVFCELPDASGPIETSSGVEVFVGAGNARVDGSRLSSTSLEAHGGAGDDILIGGAADDTFYPGPGNARIDGGTGEDTVDYSHQANGVHVNLATHSETNGHGQHDELFGIQDVLGGQGDNVLLGDNQYNKLTGGRGKDVIVAGSGGGELEGHGRAAQFVCGEHHATVAFGDSFQAMVLSSRRKTVDQACTSVFLPLSHDATTLDFAHHDPRGDRILLPLGDVGPPTDYLATITTRGYRGPLGAVHRLVRGAAQYHHVALRLSTAGANFVRHHAHLRLLVSIVERTPGSDVHRQWFGIDVHR